MPNLLILAGVPGSGKSTWAKKFFDLKYTVVSSDEIRKRLFGEDLSVAHEPSVKASNNALVFDAFHKEITEDLNHGIDVIADATNLNRLARQKLLDIAKLTNATPHLILFKNLLEATMRNAERPPETRVPKEAMDYMAAKYYDTLMDLVQEPYATVTKVESFK